ncbi:STKc_STK36 domain-containing protein fused [Haematobia irritans]|uniref:STKc_STK36 domain-containing protein fused n=1 Tax=Haematobia irritans TaxID=7368 RepID=UPI003F4F9C67
MHRYKVNAMVGEGSFGHVYRAVRKDDNQIVAIKVISKRGRTSRDLKTLRRECEIQAHLKHPNVIEMLESFETKHDLVVVTEFATIDLHRYMERNGYLREDKGQRLICDLVSALYYLHSNRILHRDLKPQNVLLDEELRAKLCDFGLARNMTMSTHMLTSIKGTPLYMAPELLEEKPYDHQADIWSLGCISYECLIGHPPFSTTSILHLIKIIKKDEVTYPGYLSKDSRSFLQGLLEKEPTMRASWAQILCHPFVEGRLYIKAGVKAENSPFVNPQNMKIKSTKSSTTFKDSNANLSQLNQKLRSIKLDESQDNMTCSRDSINAIPPSDVENLETDVEDNIIVPFANESFQGDTLINKINMDNGKILSSRPPPIGGGEMFQIPGVHMPIINSQTCYVNGNNNMILNNLEDNFDLNNTPEETLRSRPPDEELVKDNGNMIVNTLQENLALNDKTNNLDNNQGNRESVDNTDNTQRKSQLNDSRAENHKSQSQNVDKDCGSRETTHCGINESNEKLKNSKNNASENDSQKLRHSRREQENLSNSGHKSASIKASNQSFEGKHNTQNTPPCLMPGWDSCDESQSPPMESEEWLAFLERTIQEVLDGELESLKQKNLVSIIVAPLRNSKAIPKVIESVAQLLSLPFVLNEPLSIMESINKVYVDCKIVPNLMYASKLLIYERLQNDSITSLPRHIRPINEMNNEEIKCISRLYELVCHLVHLNQQFLNQFCDAVAILSANEFLINFLNQEFKNVHALRIANNILALLGCVLRELPENAELVEKIIFSSRVDLTLLLRSTDDLLRLRICMLMRLLARYSLRALQAAWSKDVREAIEQLAEDDNVEVREEAANTVEELHKFSFYS